MSDLTVAIDAGTQSIRAGLIDAAGELVDLVKVDITPYVSPQPGWAEQDPDYYWAKLCEATRALMARTDPTRLAAVSLSTQRQTVVAVDAAGTPLRPAIVWMDERKANAAQVIPRALLEATRLVGARDTLAFGLAYSRSNWMRQNEPELWERTAKFLFLSGFFTQRLTGEFVESVADVYGPWPFEVRDGRWVEPTNLRAKLFPIEPEKLPTLVDPGSVAGSITPAAAEQTGLPVGLTFVAGASDKACDLLGAGVLSREIGYISYGTTATFNVFTRDYVEVQRMLPPYPAAVPGAFHTEAQVMRGLWLVSWFAQEFGLLEREQVAVKGRSAEELLDELVADIPAGSAGLVTLPTWTPSPQSDPATRGAVFGFSDEHTRAHLYRSILEGLALAMREGADVTLKRTKTPLTQVRSSGGGSRSDVLMQVTADVFNLPTYRTHTPETSVVGAGILAAAGAGVHASIESAAAAMTRTGRVFEPISANVRTYERLRTEVVHPAPGRLLPLFRSLKNIRTS